MSSRAPSSKPKRSHSKKGESPRRSHTKKSKRTLSGSASGSTTPKRTKTRSSKDPAKISISPRSPSSTKATSPRAKSPRNTKKTRKEPQTTQATTTSPSPADVLSETQIAELKLAFSIFDKNGDGGISPDELQTFLESLGRNPTKEEVQELISAIDVDGDGEIDFDEFLVMMVEQMKPQDDEESIRASFQVFDPKSTGFILEKDLRGAFTALGDVLEVRDVDEIVGALEVRDGKIKFDELVSLMAA